MAGPAPAPGLENQRKYQESGASAKTSLELRFERESAHLIVKKIDAYDAARSDVEKRKAILNDMRGMLLAAKLTEDRDTIQQEIRLLKYTQQRFGQPGIVRLIDPDFGPSQRTWYTMEVLPAGTVCDFEALFYQYPDLQMPVSFLWHMLAQLAESLKFLYFGTVNGNRSKNWISVIHGDLHTSNLLFRFPGVYKHYPDTVMVDFGNADSSLDVTGGDDGILERLAYDMVRDTRNLSIHLRNFITKTRGNRDQLETVFNHLEAFQASDGNKDVAKALDGLIKLSKKKRDAEYEGLPQLIVHHLARRAISDDELRAFLEQLETKRS